MKDIRKADIRAEFFHLLRDWRRWWLRKWYTMVYRFVAWIAGVKLGRGVNFGGPIMLDRFKHSRIEIGDNCTFNSLDIFNPRGVHECILKTATDHAEIIIGTGSGFSGVSIVAWDKVHIGRHVMIGADTCIGDTDGHPEQLGTTPAPIVIKDNVFIGMHCLILKGVTIGENAVIGAGSVVTKDIPANSVAAGVPCRVIREKRCSQ